jgi:hypothetical protein
MQPKKTDPVRAKLEKELREAAKEVDDEGLLFLLRQAQVLIHNARVDRITTKTEKTGKTARAETPGPKGSRSAVSIEDAKDGKAIFLILGTARKVLAPEEMKRIVRICYAAETRSEALRRLFTVLARERKDILMDAGIGSPDSPLLREMFAVVRATYQLENR